MNPRVRHPHPDQLSRPPPAVVHVSRPDAAPEDELIATVRRAGQGDAAAQATLVRSYTPRIAGLIRGIVRQPSAVEDVVQVSLIKMIRSLPALRDPRVFESWLFRISRSSALDHIRRQKCRPVTVCDERQFLNAADTRRDETVAEISDALETALRHLGAKDRNLMRLLVQGYDYRTLARREGLTVGAVKARICRIRAFLRISVGVATGTRQPTAEEILRGRARRPAGAPMVERTPAVVLRPALRKAA